MRFTSRRGLLSDALQLASRVVTGRSTLPILSNVLLEVKGERLRLLTSDLELWVDCSVPVDHAEDGAITVPAKILNEVVASLPGGEVSLASEDGNAATVTSGKSEYAIQGLAAEEFPAAAAPIGGVALTLPQAALRTLLRGTEFAASADETRAILTGMLLVWNGEKLTVVATNMHRLALDAVAVAGGPAQETQTVVPVRALREVMRSLSAEAEPTARVHLGENHALFELDHVAITSRIIEGQFPNYERVIAIDAEHTVRAERLALLAALRRADIVARAEADKVILRVQPGAMMIEAESPDVGRAREEVPIELEGDQMEIAFSAQYLIDALEAMPGEQVEISLSGPLSQGVMRAVGNATYLYVAMPLQIA